MTLHVVWAPNVGPLAAYLDPTKAWQHARTMAGVDVTAIELREELPEVVRDDIESDYEGDDDTPPMADPLIAMARTRTARTPDAPDKRVVDPNDPGLEIAVEVPVEAIDDGNDGDDL